MIPKTLKKFIDAITQEKNLELALNRVSIELDMPLEQIKNKLENDLECFVKSKFIVAIVDELEKQKPPLQKINVTDLTFPCLRHAYYNKLFFEERRGRLPELLAFWIGIKLHETKIAKHHELELEYNGIYGRVDGYEDGIIYELKTVRSIPPTPYSHHIRQVEYYRVLLERSGYPVYFAIIIYVNVSNLTLKPFLILFERSLEEIEKEMFEKKEKLLEHLNKSEPPQPLPDEPWACDYCRFSYLCGYERIKSDPIKKNPH